MTEPINHEKKTTIEEGTEFKGAFSSKCPIVVRGRVEGEMSAPSLTVSVTGSVQGRVRVGEMRSEGEIAGEFDADTVHVAGTVRDNTVIRAKSLEVRLTPANGKMQVIFGECALDVGEAPSLDAALAPPAETPAPAPAPAEAKEKKNGRGKSEAHDSMPPGAGE